MKVSKLIELLKTQDQNLEVSFFWDGAARSSVDGIFLLSETLGPRKTVVLTDESNGWFFDGSKVEWIKKP